MSKEFQAEKEAPINRHSKGRTTIILKEER